LRRPSVDDSKASSDPRIFCVWLQSSDYASFLQHLGFRSDPFAKTNEDEEDLLDAYFIQPPFYSAVFGDPASPRSAVVFAPRGGGKTALKRKIELASKDASFLCVPYNTFAIEGLRLSDISREYHLRNILRLLLIGVIGECEEYGIGRLATRERHYLYLFCQNYFSQIDQSELKQAINAVKNLSDKARDWWNRFTGPVGLAINALLSRLGIKSTEIQKFEQEVGTLGAYHEQLRILADIVQRFDKTSIYVLVDPVDELALTQTGPSSFTFIAPILTDLHLLELPH